MGLQFHETVYGRDFFCYQLPALIDKLSRIADNLEKEKKSDNPLYDFIEKEVPFRLNEMLPIDADKVTKELIDDCVSTLKEHTDILFNYDRIDEALLDVCREHGIKRCD